MSEINNNSGKKFSEFQKDNDNDDSTDFCDILSIPSNPEDLFTLQNLIGNGAFGKVYKAKHNSTNKIYAIKIIDYTKDNNKENNMINYNYLSIQQEASLMKLVKDSNYIVKYYGSYYSRKSNTLWLILEYCSSGSTIDLMLSMDRTYSEIEVATIMEMILQGLILIHSKNLIHRDIKGANILLSKDGYAKLGDFGIGAQLLNEKYRKSKKGSPYWMSPQVASNLNYDFKTDIWSLGITCIELLEGEPPFSTLKPKLVIDKISKKPPRISEMIDLNEHTYEFRSFIEHCLEIDPIKRYSAKELLEHEFIQKFSKGRNYMINLIKRHENDIKKYRLESEEYQKMMKMKGDNNNDESLSIEEQLFNSKINICNGTFQEQIKDSIESINDKMEKFLNRNKIEDDKNKVIKNYEFDNIKINNNSLDLNYEKEKNYKTDKSIKIYFSESSKDGKSDINIDKEDKDEKLIFLDKDFKNTENKEKNINYSNLKIIKNSEFELLSNKNLNDIEYKNNINNNILKSSTSSIVGNNSNIGSSNIRTEDNSKRTFNKENIEYNAISIIKENMESIISSRDSIDKYFNSNDDEIRTKRDKKPLEFEFNNNDISYINNINNNKINKDENINDSDDEGLLHEAYDYDKFFIGDKYQNKYGDNI